MSDCPSPNTEGFALPNQLFDSGKCSVNTWPTLWRTQSLLNISLFEWCESEGAVGPGAQRFSADGFLAHQRWRGGGEDFVLAAGRLIGSLLTLLLQIGGKRKCCSSIKNWPGGSLISRTVRLQPHGPSEDSLRSHLRVGCKLKGELSEVEAVMCCKSEQKKRFQSKP